MTQVSVSSAGVMGNNFSRNPSISADGRFVAFESRASNLVANDSSISDIFVHDRQTGETVLVSKSTTGVHGNNTSVDAAISGNGRFVTFRSAASNLVDGDTNSQPDIFVHDRQTGETTRVSVSTAGVQSNNVSNWPVLSYDGRFVAFESNASNLVAGDTNSTSDVFVHDRNTGTTTRISLSSAGAQAAGGGRFPSISADGRYVSFAGGIGLLPVGEDTNSVLDVFVRDTLTGTTTRVSVATDGTEASNSSSGSVYSSISADGRIVAFESRANNLVPGVNNAYNDIYAHDRLTGVTSHISRSTTGDVGNADSTRPSVSEDGRYVAFQSWASNLVDDDTNGVGTVNDIFVHDRVTGETKRVNLSEAHEQTTGTFGSARPSISYSGNAVAFMSSGDNLVPNHNNNWDDIFVYGAGSPANPADLNGDGQVNGVDLGLLLGAWGQCPAPPAECPADLNGDGQVNGVDLGLLLGAWG